MTPEELGGDPVDVFRRWHRSADVVDADAVVLATADADGVPSARNVLLKGVDERGFVFYSNRGSRKGGDLAANPRACLVFTWLTPSTRRQVIVAGSVSTVSEQEADAYFATRARGSQIGAWASRQSTVIAGRPELEARVDEIEARFAGRPVPRPPFWGGYRVTPATIEFWQGRPDRLHDRIRYRRASPAGAWVVERLSP